MARLIAWAVMGVWGLNTQDPNLQLKRALKDESVPASWIYNDLDRAM